MDIRRIETLKQGDTMIGNKTRVKILKNKVAPPFKQAEFDIMYGKGIDRTGEIIDIGVKQNIIKKSGAWFSYGEERLGQGRENVKAFLNENEDIKNEIYDKIIEGINASK